MEEKGSGRRMFDLGARGEPPPQEEFPAPPKPTLPPMGITAAVGQTLQRRRTPGLSRGK